MENMNWLAVLVGALVPLVMGFIWYNPKLFGNAWMKSIGMTEEDAKKANMPVTFIVSFILAGLVAYNLAMYMGYHSPEEQIFTHGMLHGSLLSIFIALPVLITNSLFEQRNWTNIIINSLYWIVTFALVGGVVTLFM